MIATLAPDKTDKRRRKWLTLLIIELDWSPNKAYDNYSWHFGIECNYCLMRRIRASTSSRNPAVRFFLLGIGLVLVNVWVFLRREFTPLVARGPRRVDQNASALTDLLVYSFVRLRLFMMW